MFLRANSFRLRLWVDLRNANLQAKANMKKAAQQEECVRGTLRGHERRMIVQSGKYNDLLKMDMDFKALVTAHESSMELVEVETIIFYLNIRQMGWGYTWRNDSLVLSFVDS
ncbi:uncharacterized protein LOC142518080 isoform X10 [Primulina tabacum]|uniref:uncharacterized protein LOC142518080 isoform X10 n=1 Tax=Primulina tabacum TaxID=48773 RepID=UPI003F5ACA93